jgi:hypothetical protein
MMHFHRSADTTSTLVGFCTLELVALALSDVMADASNTILLVVNLPNLRNGRQKDIKDVSSLKHATFCGKIDGASKLGYTQCFVTGLTSHGSPTLEKDIQGSSISDHVRNEDTNGHTAACTAGHFYHSHMIISRTCLFPSVGNQQDDSSLGLLNNTPPCHYNQWRDCL